MAWYSRIDLPPYSGDKEPDTFALMDALNMNIYFDDIDARTCRFCFKEDWESPIVDYDVEFDELERWHRGECGLTLVALEHDPSRFSADLTFYEREEL